MNKYKQHSKISKSQFFKALYKKGSSTCAKKRSFTTEQKAINFIERSGYNLKPYKCSVCNLFHSTSINKNKQKHVDL